MRELRHLTHRLVVCVISNQGFSPVAVAAQQAERIRTPKELTQAAKVSLDPSLVHDTRPPIHPHHTYTVCMCAHLCTSAHACVLSHAYPQIMEKIPQTISMDRTHSCTYPLPWVLQLFQVLPQNAAHQDDAVRHHLDLLHVRASVDRAEAQHD